MKSFLTKNFKKILCLVMVAALVVGTINLGGLRVKAEGIPSQGSVSIVNRFATVKTVDGGEVVDVDHLVDDAVVNSASDDITISKTIRANTMTGEEYGYDITLQVQTSQTVTSKDIAVLLLFDVSNSMMDDNNHTPLTSAKAAANGFIDRLAQSAAQNSNNVKVSVVKFGSKAKTVTDWINVANDTGRTSVKNAISSIVIDENDVGGGTNMQAGLKLAANRLGMNDIANINYKYVVMFSDGGPTYRYTGSSDSTEKITNYCLNDDHGDQITKKKCDGAIAGANAVKAAGGNLYSVFLESTDYTIEEQCYTYKVDTSEYKFKKVTRDEYQSATAEKFYVENACNSNPTYVDSKSQVTTRNWKSANNHSLGYCKNCRQDWGKHSTLYYVWSPVQGDVPYTIENLLTDMSSKYECDSESGTIERAALFTASSTDDLTSAFTGVMNSISVGSTGAGWTVTDPMSEYVTFASKDDDYNSTTKTLTWVLDPDNANKSERDTNGKTVYTYTKTYHVTFNMDAYADNKNDKDKVATNGVTKLTYDGQVLNFNVPVLSAVAPTYAYTINFYKQTVDDSVVDSSAKKSYTKVDDDTVSGVARLHATVSAPEGYLSKYNADNYHYSKGADSITIGKNDNVMSIYYDRDTTTVTVNHYYVTRTYDKAGHPTESEPQPVTDTTSVYVGTKYTPSAVMKFGEVEYSFDNRNNYTNSTKPITIDKDSNKNVVDFHYIRTVDNTEYYVEVIHNYRVWNYVIDEKTGRYKEVAGAWVPETVTSVTMSGISSATYTVNVTPEPDDNTWTLVQNDGQGITEDTQKVTLTAGDKNVYNVYFEKHNDNRRPAQITVNHKYSLTATAVNNGQPSTTTTTKSAIDTFGGEGANEKWYIGETFDKAAQKNNYDGKEYTSAGTNAAKCKPFVIEEDETTINLEYTCIEKPAYAKLNVVYVYEFYENEVESDVSGAAIGFKKVLKELPDSRVSVTIPADGETAEYFVDQVITVPQNGKEGYKQNTGKTKEGQTILGSEMKVKLDDDDNQTVYVYYIKNDTDDNRDEATINVIHKYYESGREINASGADVEYGPRFVGKYETEAHTGKAGDKFTAEEAPTYNGKTYVARETNEAAKSVILQSGTNTTIVLKYDLTNQDLRNKVSVSAKYIYKEKYQEINEESGVAEWKERVVTSDAKISSPENVSIYYENERITIAAGNTSDFDTDKFKASEFKVEDQNNPGYTLTLNSDGNDFKFIYIKESPLAKGTVRVDHIYLERTIAINGEVTDVITTVTGTAIEKFEGEWYQTEANEAGDYEVEFIVTPDGKSDSKDAPMAVIKANEDQVYEFHYILVHNNSVPAKLNVQHAYTTIDWDGTRNTATSDPVTTGSFATKKVEAKLADRKGYSFKGYVVTAAAIEAGSEEGQYFVTLNGGDNALVFNYEMAIDTREDAGLTVIHEYYSKDTYKPENGEKFEGSVDKGYYGVKEGIWVGKNFDFATEGEKITAYNGQNYSFNSVSPASITIQGKTDDAADASNVIVVKYLRTYSSYVPDDNPYVPVIIPDDGGDDETEEEIIVPDVPQGDIEVEPTPEVTPEITPEPTVDVEVPEVPEALPKTGTVPNAMFFGIGGLLLLCGAALLVFGRRKEN